LRWFFYFLNLKLLFNIKRFIEVTDILSNIFAVLIELENEFYFKLFNTQQISSNTFIFFMVLEFSYFQLWLF
jgi:hypothetical protein